MIYPFDNSQIYPSSFNPYEKNKIYEIIKKYNLIHQQISNCDMKIHRIDIFVEDYCFIDKKILKFNKINILNKEDLKFFIIKDDDDYFYPILSYITKKQIVFYGHLLNNNITNLLNKRTIFLEKIDQLSNLLNFMNSFIDELITEK
jgi:hypothetical protein